MRLVLLQVAQSYTLSCSPCFYARKPAQQLDSRCQRLGWVLQGFGRSRADVQVCPVVAFPSWQILRRHGP